jgi:hypothetical protein
MPVGLVLAALDVTAHWEALAAALCLSTSDASCLARSAFEFAVAARVVTTCADRGLSQRTASSLAELLCGMLELCRPQQAAFEVAAAAAPPDQLLLVLQSAGGVLLEAFEAGKLRLKTVVSCVQLTSRTVARPVHVLLTTFFVHSRLPRYTLLTFGVVCLVVQMATSVSMGPSLMRQLQHMSMSLIPFPQTRPSASTPRR